MKIRAVVSALPFLALALTGCDEEPPAGGEACQVIIDLCHDVDPGHGPIAECHDIGHDLDEDACAPIEAECVALCEAAAQHPQPDAGTHDHDEH